MECNFRNHTIRWQIAKSTNVSHKFCAVCSYCFTNILFNILYLQDLGQGHGVQFTQLHHSMANIKICICHPPSFALAV